MNKEKLYKIAPVWLQNFMISLYGKQLMKKRYGKTYWEALEFFRTKDYSDLPSAKEEQLESLKRFLKYAITHSKYYAQRISPEAISTLKTMEGIGQFPTTTKEQLRENIEDIYTLPEEEAIISFTGGTTGKSLKVRFREDDFQTRMAYLDAFKYRVGVEPFKDRKATFSGRSLVHNSNSKIFWRDNKPYRQRLYSTFHLKEENLSAYIKNLNAYRPQIINGFVSAIYEVAEYIHRKKIELSFSPKAIFTTSETLLPHHRERIESVFNSRIYNQYASAEGAPFITECTFGNLHYNIDTGVIETNEENEILVTSFTTRGTPLIRYQIKDLVYFKNGTCGCGSCHPLVERIEGRKVEFLQSKTKGKVSLSHLADVIKGIPNSIVKIQFIQKSLTALEIKVVIDESKFEEVHLEKLRNELEYRFGKDMYFGIQQVKDIPKEKSGKYALIKNYLSHGAS